MGVYLRVYVRECARERMCERARTCACMDVYMRTVYAKEGTFCKLPTSRNQQNFPADFV